MNSKFILAASLSLVLAFTFSCSSDDGEKSETHQIYNASDITEWKITTDASVAKNGLRWVLLYSEDEE